MSSDAAPELLTSFNRKWERLDAIARRCMPPPWYAPGTLLTPELHGAYQRYLPVGDYLLDLRLLLLATLPHPSWLPHAVRHPHAFPSIAALWRTLPDHLGGRLTWDFAELWPLACALADPEAFGSRAGRYPEQQAWLAALDLPPAPFVIEHACGTGQSTWELAHVLAATGRRPLVLGVTREPLEAWMATHRRLPHYPELPAQRTFPEPPPAGAVYVVAGDLRTFTTRRPADLIACNGLLGGPALHHEAELRLVLQRLHQTLADDGYLMIGDRFHAGWEAARASVRNLASRDFNTREVSASSLLLQKRPALPPGPAASLT